MYVVTGGGGRFLRPLESCRNGTPEPIVQNDRVHHFLILEIDDLEIRGTAFDDVGQSLDSFVIALGR